MIQGTDLSLLSQWQNSYMIMGTSAATLTGLMFVVTTLIAGIDRNAEILNAGISAFNTPTVVHFCAVLLLGLFGLGMVFYQLIIMRRIWWMPHYRSTLEDWLWYMALPLLAHVSLIIAVFTLPENPALALYIVSFAMILLLLVGIRNSWDNVTFLAIRRSQPENTRREKKRGGSSNQENRKSQS